MGKEFSQAQEDDDLSLGIDCQDALSMLKSKKPSLPDTKLDHHNHSIMYSHNNINKSEEEHSFSVNETLPDLNKTNGFLPTSILQKVFMFAEVQILNALMRTCSLFHEIINTHLFWKEYCISNTNYRYEKDQEKVENWKLEYANFFFSKNNDDYYSEKYKLHFFFDDETEIVANPKICVIGESFSGKTSLVTRFEKDEFIQKEQPTIGVRYVSVGINRICDNTNMKFQIWDASGHERFKSLIPMYYRDADIIIICFSLNKNNFEKIEKILERINDEKHKFLLIGTKCDLKRKIDRNDVQQLIKKDKRIRSYIETSSKKKINILTTLCILFEIITENNEEM